MSSAQQLLSAYGPFTCDAADFDGTNDYLTRGGLFTGAANSKLVTFVIWFKVDIQQDGDYLFNVDAAFGIQTNNTGVGTFQIQAATTGVVINLAAVSASASYSSTTWNCIMFSCDMADSAKRHWYSGDTNIANLWTTYSNSVIQFAGATNASVGALSDSTAKFDGGIAEWWFAPGVYIDLSVQANRRLFYSPTGKPVFLGGTGEVPTGTAPIAYLHTRDGEAPANFAINRGTGGNLTVNGTLTNYASSPSD